MSQEVVLMNLIELESKSCMNVSGHINFCTSISVFIGLKDVPDSDTATLKSIAYTIAYSKLTLLEFVSWGIRVI